MLRMKALETVTNVEFLCPIKIKVIDFDGTRTVLIHRATEIDEETNGVYVSDCPVQGGFTIIECHSNHVGGLTPEQVRTIIKDSLERGYVDFDSIPGIKAIEKGLDYIPTDKTPYLYGFSGYSLSVTPFFEDEEMPYIDD